MNQEKKMGITIQVEEAAITAAAIYLLSFYNLGLSLWIWILLFFSPDVSMLGYLLGTRIGAVVYNIFHHRAVAIVIALTGYVQHLDILTASGLLLLAHSSFDRMLGFGLKYPDDFKHTSLGWGKMSQ